MSMRDIILTIVEKNDNHILLNNLEKSILDMYINDLTNLVKNNNLMVDLNVFFENIKNNLINKKISIIKFTFSNKECIYVNKNTLINIEYFKIMFDSCDYSDEFVCEVYINEHYDNFTILQSIILFVETGTYNNITELHDIINMMKIVNYFGCVSHGNNNLMGNIANNIIFCYFDVVIDVYVVENVYTILKNYNVKNIVDIINKLWKLCDTSTKLPILTFFDDVVINTYVGIEYIANNNYYNYYNKIYNNGVISIQNKIINDLLNMNTKESYNIIINIKKNNENIDNILVDNIDKITEIIFDCDISIFNTTLQLLLMLQFSKMDMLNKRFENMNLYNLNKKVFNKLLSFIKMHNPDNENVNKIFSSCGNWYTKYILKSLIPFEYYEVTKIGNIVNITDNSIKVEVSLSSGNIIDANTKIIYFDSDNKAITLTLKQIKIPYTINDEYNLMDCHGIVGGHAYYKYSQTYVFIVDDYDTKIRDKADLYIIG